MNKKIKQKWVAALRSGDYKQGIGRLRLGDKFCCLGVLCDIFIKETGQSEWINNCSFVNKDGTETDSFLPYCVSVWAGLRSTNPSVNMSGERVWLSVMNDQENSFSYIANKIESLL